jgi:hypothetical protein
MTLIALDKLLGWAVRYVHNLLVSHYVPNITILFVPYPLPEIALPPPPYITWAKKMHPIFQYNLLFWGVSKFSGFCVMGLYHRLGIKNTKY